METGTTKAYILPPLPQVQAPKVMKVSPQPQDMTGFYESLTPGIKKSMKRIKKLKPKLNIDQLKIAYTGGTLTPFFERK